MTFLVTANTITVFIWSFLVCHIVMSSVYCEIELTSLFVCPLPSPPPGISLSDIDIYVPKMARARFSLLGADVIAFAEDFCLPSPSSCFSCFKNRSSLTNPDLLGVSVTKQEENLVSRKEIFMP